MKKWMIVSVLLLCMVVLAVLLIMLLKTPEKPDAQVGILLIGNCVLTDGLPLPADQKVTVVCENQKLTWEKGKPLSFKIKVPKSGKSLDINAWTSDFIWIKQRPILLKPGQKKKLNLQFYHPYEFALKITDEKQTPLSDLSLTAEVRMKDGTPIKEVKTTPTNARGEAGFTIDDSRMGPGSNIIFRVTDPSQNYRFVSLSDSVILVPMGRYDITHEAVLTRGRLPGEVAGLTMIPEIKILDFGKVPVGNTVQRTLIARNDGENVVTVSAAFDGSPGMFQLMEGASGPVLLNPRKEMVWKFQFVPSAAGTQQNRFMVKSSDPVKKTMQYMLKGQGIQPAHPVYTVKLIVNNSGTGKALSDADVLVDNIRVGKTGSQGDITIDLGTLESGVQKKIQVKKNGYEAQTFMMKADPAATTLDTVLKLKPTGVTPPTEPPPVSTAFKLTVTVTDKSGNPVKGAKVLLDNQLQDLTNTSGQIEKMLQNVKSGESYNLDIKKPGFDDYHTTLTLDPADPHIKLSVRVKTALLTVNAKTDPAGAVLTLEGIKTRKKYTVNTNGSVRVEPDRYNYRIDKPNYKTETGIIDLEKNTEETISKKLRVDSGQSCAERLGTADSHLNSGNIEMAREILEQIDRTDKRCYAEAQAKLSKIYITEKDWEAARIACDNALNIDSRLYNARYNQAIVYLSTEEYQKSINQLVELNRVINIIPVDERRIYILDRLYMLGYNHYQLFKTATVSNEKREYALMAIQDLKNFLSEVKAEDTDFKKKKMDADQKLEEANKFLASY